MHRGTSWWTSLFFQETRCSEGSKNRATSCRINSRWKLEEVETQAQTDQESERYVCLPPTPGETSNGSIMNYPNRIARKWNLFWGFVCLFKGDPAAIRYQSCRHHGKGATVQHMHPSFFNPFILSGKAQTVPPPAVPSLISYPAEPKGNLLQRVTVAALSQAQLHGKQHVWNSAKRKEQW